MKKSLSFLLLVPLLLLTASAARAAAVGEWTYYKASHNATLNIPVDDKIYSLHDGNLLIYDIATEEVTEMNKIDGLNGTEISFMAYSDEADCLLLIYSDLNIDLLATNGTITNLPQIKNADDGTLEVNHVTVTGTDAALGMGDGVVHIDLARQEIHGYYDLGTNVNSAAIFNNYLYIATDAAIMACSMDANLSDPALWKTVSSAVVTLFTPFADNLYCVSASSGIMLLTSGDGGAATLTQVSSFVPTGTFSGTSAAVFINSSQACVIEADAPTVIARTLTLPSGSNALTIDNDGYYWSSDGMNGLNAYGLSGGELVATGVSVGGYGPRRNLCYYMTYEGDRLLIAGGRLDPYGLLHYDGTIMKYENNRWSAFQDDGISDITGVPYRDITCIAQDPADSSHHYASAGGTGLYEFRSGQFVQHYSLDNSTLRSAASNNSPRYVRVDGLNYDADGNLWMINNGVDTVVHVLMADGTWVGVYVEALDMAPTLEKTLFDSSGRFWIASRRTTSNPAHTAGLLCLDYNGTIADISDDVTTYRARANNEDGTSCDFSGGVYEIVEDTDGSIWFGTASGLYVIDNPDEWSYSDFYVTQIKVPRNDGTNNADYLLSGVSVSAIAIDGADRKWIGTLGNGLYLVSADGTEIISHFEAATSLLLSDNIYDIAINQSTGEVMIGTDVGLCSYQSDATSPADALVESNVKVYPNPVRPNYSGNVTVTGLTADADVKVTTSGGQAVASGTSTGGTFIWDCRTSSGERVSAGVYYILVSTADGNTGIAAKVVVI